MVKTLNPSFQEESLRLGAKPQLALVRYRRADSLVLSAKVPWHTASHPGLSPNSSDVLALPLLTPPLQKRPVSLVSLKGMASRPVAQSLCAQLRPCLFMVSHVLNLTHYPSTT